MAKSKIFSATLGALLATSGALLFLTIAPLQAAAVAVDFDPSGDVSQSGDRVYLNATVLLRAQEEIPILAILVRVLDGECAPHHDLEQVHLLGVKLVNPVTGALEPISLKVLGPAGGRGGLNFGYGYGYDEGNGLAVSFDFGYGYGYGYGGLGGGEATLRLSLRATLTSNDVDCLFTGPGQASRAFTVKVGVVAEKPDNTIVPPSGTLTPSGKYIFFSPGKSGVIIGNPDFTSGGGGGGNQPLQNGAIPPGAPPQLQLKLGSVFTTLPAGGLTLTSTPSVGGQFSSLASFGLQLGDSEANLALFFEQFEGGVDPLLLPDVNPGQLFPQSRLYKLIHAEITQNGVPLDPDDANALLAGGTTVELTVRIELSFIVTNNVRPSLLRLQKFDEGELVGTFAPSSISPNIVDPPHQYIEVTFEVPGFSVFAIGFVRPSGGGFFEQSTPTEDEGEPTPTAPAPEGPTEESSLGTPENLRRMVAGQAIRRTTRVTWDAVPGATSYLVEVCRDPSCLQILETRQVVTTDITFGGSIVPLGPGTYYWRVTAMSDEAAGTPSSTRSFTISEVETERSATAYWVIGGLLAAVAVLAGVGYLAYSRGWLDRFRKGPSP